MTEFIKVNTKPCIHCGRTSELTVPVEGLTRWHQGEKIQHALPELTAGQRELLLTGTHETCWNQIMGDDDDD